MTPQFPNFRRAQTGFNAPLLRYPGDGYTPVGSNQAAEDVGGGIGDTISSIFGGSPQLSVMPLPGAASAVAGSQDNEGDLLRKNLQEIHNRLLAIKGVDPKEVNQAIEESGAMPGPLEIEKAHLGADVGAWGKYMQALGAIPVPQEAPHVAEEYPGLNLPQVPERGQVQRDPTASIGAAIAGLFAPQYAGQFGASALHGALAANEQNFEDQKQRYSQQLQQTQMQHQDALQARNDREKTKLLNEDRAFQYSLDKEKRDMSDASDTWKQANIKGALGAIGDLVPREQTAQKARIRLQKMEAEQKASQAQADKLAKMESDETKAYVAHLDRMKAEADRAEHRRTLEDQANARLGRPVALPPGGSLVNPQTGEVVGSRAPMPQPYTLGQGLRNPLTGEPIVKATAKPRAGSAPLHDKYEKGKLWAAINKFKIADAEKSRDQAEKDVQDSTKAVRAADRAVRDYMKAHPSASTQDKPGSFFGLIGGHSPDKGLLDVLQARGDAEEDLRKAKTARDHYANEARRQATPPEELQPSQSSKGKKLDQNTAKSILKEAGGDNNRAREIAKQRGYAL